MDPGSFGPLPNCEMKYLQFIKARLLKVTLTIAATFLIVHYWRHMALETQHFEPLFSIGFRKSKLKTESVSGAENVTVYEGAEDLNLTSSHNGTGPVPSSPVYYSPGLTGRSSNETVLCPSIPPNLEGLLKVDISVPKMSDLEKEFAYLEPGGMFRPKECKARYLVALVIPYRNRPTQLPVFLNNIHRLLLKQQIDYGIFVVEQDGNGPFNRAKLMNVGFVEASKIKKFDCFIFHDVDLIPEDDRNLYTCPEQPRHMSVAVDKFKYKLPYKELFGGVCAFSREHFELLNGFSNMFWGWGGEDDEMYYRIRKKDLHVSRYPPTTARYKMLRHVRQPPNPKRFEVLQKSKKHINVDGLKNLDYDRKAIEFKRLYTWILADIHPPQKWLMDFSRFWTA